MADTLNIAIAQINLHLGAIDKNVAAIRAARAKAAELGADLVVTPELSISGYPPEDLVLKPAFVAALRGSGADPGPGHRRWRPGADHRHALEQRGQAAQRRLPARWRRASPRGAPRWSCPITACSTRSACSIAGAARRPDHVPRLPPRADDLRGLVAAAMSPHDLAETGRGNAALHQRLALRGRQAAPAHPSRHPARAGNRAALSSSPPWSAARTRWCSTAPPSSSTPTVRSRCRCRNSREAVTLDATGPARRTAWSAQPQPIAPAAGPAGADLPGDDVGPARLCEQERLPRRGARPFGRHRLRHLRRRRRRCAGAGARARRDAAQPLHLRPQPGGCRGLRQDARHPV